jgi:GTP cyclohydrolase II
MDKEDWNVLLTNITDTITQKADEESEGEFTTPQEILAKLSEFRNSITDTDNHLAAVKSTLIDYTSHLIRVKNQE